MATLSIGPVNSVDDVRVAAGYGNWSRLISWDDFVDRHINGSIEPEFSRRLQAALWYANTVMYQETGLIIGVGSGGPRSFNNPVSGASRANRSFHQLQQFWDGKQYWMAADLVVWQGDGKANRSPRWSEVEFFKDFALHAFIGENTDTNRDDEPWHIQTVEVRGWQAWVNRGRQYPIPNRAFTYGPDQTTPGVWPIKNPAPDPVQPPHGKTIPQKATTNIMKALPVLDITNPGPTVKDGHVMRLQALLNLMEQNEGDKPIAEDGFFGPVTQSLLIEYQGKRNLAQDGVCGKKTWAAIMGVPEAV